MEKHTAAKFGPALVASFVCIAAGTILVAALSLAPRPAVATPSFASTNGNKPCGFCHVPGTQGASPAQLNTTGEYFKTTCLYGMKTTHICWKE